MLGDYLGAFLFVCFSKGMNVLMNVGASGGANLTPAGTQKM